MMPRINYRCTDTHERHYFRRYEGAVIIVYVKTLRFLLRFIRKAKPLPRESGKLPGKTEYYGRRRNATRKSGFKSHKDSTGGVYMQPMIQAFLVGSSCPIVITFTIPEHRVNDFVGYGMWYCIKGPFDCDVEGGHGEYTISHYEFPNWNKVGSIWRSDNTSPQQIKIKIHAHEDTIIAFWSPGAGVIEHEYLINARPEILHNMHLFSPEANKDFYSRKGDVEFYQALEDAESQQIQITLKSCNRCARFLPINIENERNHLSFSNHCVAENRRPCKHGGFGILTNVETGEKLQLEYGFQLECRFCKKFVVNQPLNPMRTAAQMKEDAARRRALELLLQELYGGTPQLFYRHETGLELTDAVWDRFEGRCFRCGKPLSSKRAMHLDHTRPLKLLWPLDGSATALCANCNNEKRDRPPCDFYTDEELDDLSTITGMDRSELKDPSPNVEAVRLLLDRLDWFFDEFLMTPEMRKEHDGKIAGELLVKALQKVLEACPEGTPIDLIEEYEKRVVKGS